MKQEVALGRNLEGRVFSASFLPPPQRPQCKAPSPRAGHGRGCSPGAPALGTRWLQLSQDHQVPKPRPPQPSKGVETTALKRPKGKGQSRRASDRPLPGPPDKGGVPKGGGFPVLSGVELGPSPRGTDTGSLPFGDHLAARVWPGPTPSSPSFPGQPASRQSVPNSVHTQRLPAPAGSSGSAGQEVWPAPSAHTHWLAPGWTAAARCEGPIEAQIAGGCRAVSAGLCFRTRGAAVSPLLFMPDLGAPWSTKPEKRGQSVPAVTSLLPCSSRRGSFSCQLRSELVTREASEEESPT